MTAKKIMAGFAALAAAAAVFTACGFGFHTTITSTPTVLAKELAASLGTTKIGENENGVPIMEANAVMLEEGGKKNVYLRHDVTLSHYKTLDRDISVGEWGLVVPKGVTFLVPGYIVPDDGSPGWSARLILEDYARLTVDGELIVANTPTPNDRHDIGEEGEESGIVVRAAKDTAAVIHGSGVIRLRNPYGLALFTVSDGKGLTITDSVKLDGCGAKENLPEALPDWVEDTKDASENDAPLILVEGGAVTMSGSSALSGNAGGGVLVTDGEGEGTFTMSGSASVAGNSAAENGGGVRVEGGGKFTMSGSASVTGNRAEKGDGGGVYAADGAFTMADSAVLAGNSAVDGSGGGVYVGAGGTFTMSGGRVQGTKAGAGFAANTAKFGAALYNDGSALWGDPARPVQYDQEEWSLIVTPDGKSTTISRYSLLSSPLQ